MLYLFGWFQNKQLKKFAVLSFCALGTLSFASAAYAAADANKPEAAASEKADKKTVEAKKPSLDKNRVEFQFEYLDARFFNNRNVNT